MTRPMKAHSKELPQPASARRRLHCALSVLVALCIGVLSPNSRTLADIFENRLSLETRLIEFSVGPVRYRVPRNFLFEMDNWTGGAQQLVSLRVKYPGLVPLTEETKPCFLKQVHCQLLEFHIEKPNDRSTEAFFLDRRFLFHSQTPEAGPFGYEIYKVGPDNARMEYLRKVLPDRTILFTCQPFDNRGQPDGVCQSFIRTRSGGQVSYFFSVRQLGEADEIQAGLRDLVDSFAIGAPR